MFWQITVGLLVGAGVLLILLDLLRIPYVKTSQAVGTLKEKQKHKESRINIWLESLAEWLGKHIRLSDYKRGRLKTDLISARIEITPERYTADAIVSAGVIGILAIPVWFVHPIFTLILLALAIYQYLQRIGSVSRRLSEKRENIEGELESLVFTVENTLRHSRDVVYMLQTQMISSGDDLRRELEITVADMKSGNNITAIKRLESRVGSSLMSDVCRGLISVLEGNDTSAYWTTLEIKLSEHNRQLLKRRAQKIPRRVRRLSMALLICFIAVFFTVILSQIISQLGDIF